MSLHMFSRVEIRGVNEAVVAVVASGLMTCAAERLAGFLMLLPKSPSTPILRARRQAL